MPTVLQLNTCKMFNMVIMPANINILLLIYHVSIATVTISVC